MANTKNLKPRTTLSKEEAKKMGRKGGKASVESRRNKKLMSQIYGEFLAEKFAVNVDGKKQDMTGEKLVNSVVKKVLISGGAAAVSLMKEIREATEGSKIAIDHSGEITEITPAERAARIAEILAKAGA